MRTPTVSTTRVMYARAWRRREPNRGRCTAVISERGSGGRDERLHQAYTVSSARPVRAQASSRIPCQESSESRECRAFRTQQGNGIRVSSRGVVVHTTVALVIHNKHADAALTSHSRSSGSSIHELAIATTQLDPLRRHANGGERCPRHVHAHEPSHAGRAVRGEANVYGGQASCTILDNFHDRERTWPSRRTPSTFPGPRRWPVRRRSSPGSRGRSSEHESVEENVASCHCERSIIAMKVMQDTPRRQGAPFECTCVQFGTSVGTRYHWLP